MDESYKVSLYKREFLGIDKECDSDAHITKEDYDKLVKNIKLEKYVLMVEGILVFLCIAIGLFIMIRAEAPECAVFFNIFAALIIYFICVICQSVALAKIMYYSLSYDCSDNITNELFSKENQNTQKQITYSALNLSLDIFFILLMICDVCHDEIKECCNCCNCDCTCPKCSCCPCCTCCFCCTCCPGCPCCDCTKKRINMQNIVTRENNDNNLIILMLIIKALYILVKALLIEWLLIHIHKIKMLFILIHIIIIIFKIIIIIIKIIIIIIQIIIVIIIKVTLLL